MFPRYSGPLAIQTCSQTQRTIAVIKALGAVAPAIVSREVYYPGGKYLVPILQLLIPGIDLVSSIIYHCAGLTNCFVE